MHLNTTQYVNMNCHLKKVWKISSQLPRIKNNQFGRCRHQVITFVPFEKTRQILSWNYNIHIAFNFKKIALLNEKKGEFLHIVFFISYHTFPLEDVDKLSCRKALGIKTSIISEAYLKVMDGNTDEETWRVFVKIKNLKSFSRIFTLFFDLYIL